MFDNLNKLRSGDKLSVIDKDGKATNFVVRQLRVYSPNEDATEVFRSSDGKAHLNLITCQGVWNKGRARYSKRLVVFTDKSVDQRPAPETPSI